MKMKLWIKVIGAVCVLLVAATVAAISVLKSMDFNDFKTTIEAYAVQATGRTVTIHGDLNLDISISPSLNVSDVTIGNAAWGEDQPLVVLKNLKAKVDLMSLLTGQVDVDYFVVDGLILNLQTDGKGLANWEFDLPEGGVAQQPTSSGLSFTPRVRDVRLNNVDLTYSDGATGGTFKVRLASADIQADTFDSPMSAVIRAAYNGVNFDAKADLGSLHLFVGAEGEAFPVDLTVKASGLKAHVVGSVEQPRAGMTVNAHVTSQVTNMGTLGRLADLDLSFAKALQARFAVTGQGAHYAFSDIAVTTDGSDVTGALDLDVTNKRSRLSGRLSSNLINVPKSLQSSPATGPVFTTDPLALAGLQGVDLDVTYGAKKVSLEGLHLSNVNTKIKLDAGRLQIKPLNLNLGGGGLSGVIKLNSASKPPKVTAGLNIKGVDIGQVIAGLGYGDLASLKLNGKLDVKSSGASTRALMQSLNGTVALSGRDGRIKAATIKEIGATEISCFVGRLPIKNGSVIAQAVMLDTPKFDAHVTGNIDLPGERLHLTVIPQAKSTGLVSFAVPVRLKGSLREPVVGLDATEAIAGTVGNIVKAPVGVLVDILGALVKKDAQDPCLKMLGGGKTIPKTSNAPSPQPKPQAKPKPQAANPVQNLGNALQGLFGK